MNYQEKALEAVHCTLRRCFSEAITEKEAYQQIVEIVTHAEALREAQEAEKDATEKANKCSQTLTLLYKVKSKREHENMDKACQFSAYLESKGL